MISIILINDTRDHETVLSSSVNELFHSEFRFLPFRIAMNYNMLDSIVEFGSGMGKKII